MGIQLQGWWLTAEARSENLSETEIYFSRNTDPCSLRNQDISLEALNLYECQLAEMEPNASDPSIVLGILLQDSQRMRNILADKKWIGFDLDDTLHEFRRASAAATKAVLTMISGRYYIPMSTLQEEYAQVLQEHTVHAFSDGKTSHDYRRERFSSLLEQLVHPLPQNTVDFMDQLVGTYEAILVASLEAKCGALDLLSTIKSMGKRIVIITEGPQDAQERTIEVLGITKYVDFLATTNYFEVSKIDGLFPRVLQYLHISPSDIVYVGDSASRDMVPAMREGIFSIHLSEAHIASLNVSPPQINNLRQLQHILYSDSLDSCR